MVEITTRTTGWRFLLKPSPELNARILGIIARALWLYPVSLHAFVFLSNHWYALASAARAELLASFVGYVNGNVAKAVQEIYGWTETVWARRAEMIPVADDEAAEGRLRYILAHGVKEGLVATPFDWPGVSSARALALGETLTGTWRARWGRAVRPKSASDIYPIDLVPIPSHADLSTHERQQRVMSIIDSIVEAEAGRSPLGRAEVIAQDPTSRPPTFVRRPAPLVHAALLEVRNAFVAARSRFVKEFREAAVRVRAAALVLAASFPLGAFPSPLPPNSPRPSGTVVVEADGRLPVVEGGRGDTPADAQRPPELAMPSSSQRSPLMNVS
jgi:hypothetical protein